MKKYIVYFSSLWLVVASCTAPRDLFEMGDYYNATVRTAEKLKNHPNNKNALLYFSKSYPITLGQINLNLENISTAPYDANLELLKKELQKINTLSKLFDSTNERLAPYGQPLAFLQDKAAQLAVEIGENELSKRSRKGLLQEYHTFKDIPFLSSTSYSEFLKAHAIKALYEENNISDSSFHTFQSALTQSLNNSLLNITSNKNQETSAEQRIAVTYLGFKMDSLVLMPNYTNQPGSFPFRYTIVIRCKAAVTITDAKTKAVLLTTEVEGNAQWVSRSWYKYVTIYNNALPKAPDWRFRYSNIRLDEFDRNQASHRYKILYGPAKNDLQRKLIDKLNEFYNL